MLDLNFVRANLELVEEKLRARGMDPEALLGDFRELDQERRSRITQAETLQAHRNKLSQEVARSRKAGVEAAQVAAVMDQTRELKQETEELERARPRRKSRCAIFWDHPQPDPGQRALRKERSGERRGIALGPTARV